MEISLILVTYNRADQLVRIFNSIISFGWKYQSFLVIDNCSTDITPSIIRNFESELEIEYILSSDNIGHGAGIALGLKRLNNREIKPKYVVFLEDDSIPQYGYLNFLIQSIKKSTFSMISSGGYRVGLGSRANLNPREGEILEADFGLFDGAIAKFEDLMRVGYPVEDWFMMFDDFEYCYRIRKAGFQIGIIHNPHVEILHEGWGGGNTQSHLWRTYYQSRNFILFVRRHFSWFNFWDALILNLKRLLGGLFAKNSWQVTKLRLLGYHAGILGKKGRSLDLKTLKEVL